MPTLIASAAFAVAVVVSGTVALAFDPPDKSFGGNRDDWVHDHALADTWDGNPNHAFAFEEPGPGASEVGRIQSDRAGDNGEINREYKTDHDIPGRRSDRD